MAGQSFIITMEYSYKRLKQAQKLHMLKAFFTVISNNWQDKVPSPQWSTAHTNMGRDNAKY